MCNKHFPCKQSVSYFNKQKTAWGMLGEQEKGLWITSGRRVIFKLLLQVAAIFY